MLLPSRGSQKGKEETFSDYLYFYVTFFTEVYKHVSFLPRMKLWKLQGRKDQEGIKEKKKEEVSCLRGRGRDKKKKKRNFEQIVVMPRVPDSYEVTILVLQLLAGKARVHFLRLLSPF